MSRDAFVEGAARAERREGLRRLATEPFDVVVVGGGINGAGIAREAALRGLRTALVDKGDFASGTSSRSSKLIHGGIRYLEHGHVGLVLEASRERDLLRRTLAPHLVKPLPFFFPVWRTSPVGLWKLRAGLLLYDVLAAFRNIRRHRVFGARRALALESGLLAEGLRGGALYYDCWTDDARLVLETVLAAESAGAVCLNYVEVEGFGKSDGRIDGLRLRDLDGGERWTTEARVVVNATGPWLDRLRALDDPGARPCLRLTKGVHVVVPRDRVGNRHAIVLHAVRDGRVLFVIPWEDRALIGTTDTDFDGIPDDVAADDHDVAYLLETVNHWFPRAHLTDGDVIATTAGLRPLVAGPDGSLPSEISREEEIFESPSGLLSLGGGKLTTYRRIAIKVVDRIAERLASEHGIRAQRASGTDRKPLPGALGEPPPAAPGDVVASHLVSLYGARAGVVLDAIREAPELGRRLVADTPHLAVEAWFGAAHERALRVEDVLRRRTQVKLRARDHGESARESIRRWMAGPLGGTPAESDAGVPPPDGGDEDALRRREA